MIVSVNVRTILYGMAALALTMLTSPDGLRNALAASASALVEATPFLFAGAALTRLCKGRWRAAEYLGCGCGGGPSARSLPAAAATWLLFGPYVALARFGAASAAAWILSRSRRHCDQHAGEVRPLRELAGVVPAALLAGVAAQFNTFFGATHLTAVESALAGALFGFVAAPCGLGAVAVAGTLRQRDPIAAAAFLCIAGLVDMRALRVRTHSGAAQDGFAYIILAAALGIVAWRHGDALVHPAFAAPAAFCAVAAVCLALVARQQRCAAARVAPAVMLTGALLGAPPPQYHATETTMRDLFAGERLSFTGALVRASGASAIVRYAITCCRADAAPIAVRLERPPPYGVGEWLHVEGVVDDRDGAMQLHAQRIELVPPPSDPFVYW